MYQGRNQTQVENNYVIGLAAFSGLVLSLLLFFIIEFLAPLIF